MIKIDFNIIIQKTYTRRERKNQSDAENNFMIIFSSIDSLLFYFLYPFVYMKYYLSIIFKCYKYL